MLNVNVYGAQPAVRREKYLHSNNFFDTMLYLSVTLSRF